MFESTVASVAKSNTSSICSALTSLPNKVIKLTIYFLESGTFV